jgi:SAM-dependent methyltransferase
MRVRRIALGAGAAVLAGSLWARYHPSACPYSQRWLLEIPRPWLSRSRLREVLEPVPGERILEVGPGTGFFALPVAKWIQGGDGRGAGTLEVFDLQQEMLDDTMRRATERGLQNIEPRQGDATSLPYEDGAFDAVYLVTVLGQIPDQDGGLSTRRSSRRAAAFRSPSSRTPARRVRWSPAPRARPRRGLDADDHQLGDPIARLHPEGGLAVGVEEDANLPAVAGVDQPRRVDLQHPDVFPLP